MSFSREVYSSHVARVSYDSETKEMTVEWDNGRPTVYMDVPEELAEKVATNWSVGEALHNWVKKKYQWRPA